MQLSFRQKEKLSDFFGNLAVAWIAGGIIGPFVTNWNVENIDRIVYISIIAATIFMSTMLYLVKEVKNG